MPDTELDTGPEALARRMASVPINQLAMQKLMINQAMDFEGLMNTQRFATLFDGITRHSSEGGNYTERSKQAGWRQAVQERDHGTRDWTKNEPVDD